MVADAPTVEWKGHVIGFCCPGCDAEFLEWPDDKKDAFVAKFVKPDAASSHGDHTGEPDQPKTGISHYTCPMHPSVKAQSADESCPICGMDLKPVTYEAIRQGAVDLDRGRRQLIGVKTEIVQRRSLQREVEAMGMVTYDPTRISDIAPRFAGWAGEVFADFIGKQVEKGDPLLEVFSRELSTTQIEYQSGLADHALPAEKRLSKAAERRLRLLGFGDEDLIAMASADPSAEYFVVRAPRPGTLIDKHINDGGRFDEGQRIMRIADLSVVWVEAELYEHEAAMVQVGDKARIKLSYLSGRTFESKVMDVVPFLDEGTRTVRVRLSVDNSDRLFKPGMFATVHLADDLGEKLVVPDSAVLDAGDAKIVFVEQQPGRFFPRRIETGTRTAKWIEVTDGLAAGESIVTRGNFLIASESRLISGIDKWR